MQIWEREGLLDPEDLVAEAARRNDGVGKDVLGIDPIRPVSYTHLTLPTNYSV